MNYDNIINFLFPDIGGFKCFGVVRNPKIAKLKCCSDCMFVSLLICLSFCVRSLHMPDFLGPGLNRPAWLQSWSSPEKKKN